MTKKNQILARSNEYLRREGDAFKKIDKIFGDTAVRAHKAGQQAVAQLEASVVYKMIIEGIKASAPGGVPFKPNTKLTLAIRQLRGMGSGYGNSAAGKPLIAEGDLIGGFEIQKRPDGSYAVLIPRNKRHSNNVNLNLAKLADMQETGYKIKVTSRMLRFFHFVLSRTTDSTSLSAPSGNALVEGSIITVPARPILDPVFKAYLEQRPRMIRDLEIAYAQAYNKVCGEVLLGASGGKRVNVGNTGFGIVIPGGKGK